MHVCVPAVPFTTDMLLETLLDALCMDIFSDVLYVLGAKHGFGQSTDCTV